MYLMEFYTIGRKSLWKNQRIYFLKSYVIHHHMSSTKKIF